jgi:sortase A
VTVEQPRQRPTSVEKVSSPELTPPSPRTRIWLGTLDVVGRALIALGVLLLAFVAYQLWGTGIAESRAQDSLATEFEAVVQNAPTQTTTPLYGDVISQIQIPSIDVDKYVVAGVDAKSLQKGPGLFPGSPLAGQLGNVAITGHRTTYGAPFSRINEMSVGDEIILKTPEGEFTYIVNAEPFIVEPTQTEVAKTTDPDSAILTLISCHPRWTSEKRIVVTAALVPTVEPAPPTEFVAQTGDYVPELLNEGWFHDAAAWPWVLLWFFVLLGLYVAAIAATRRGVRAYFSYPVMAVVMLPVLFIFFQHLSRLLPTNL